MNVPKRTFTPFGLLRLQNPQQRPPNGASSNEQPSEPARIVDVERQKYLTPNRQYRYVIDRWIWELPAGSVDPGEDLESAARRECHEEIGRVPERVERIGEYYPTPGYSDELMVFFRLTQLTVPETRAAADADEILEPRIFSLAEARSLIAGSDTQDMKTVLGLTLV